VIERLLKVGASVGPYDPVAMDNACRSLPPAWLKLGKLELVAGARALTLMTEWKASCHPGLGSAKNS
jgi:hypothetical protein